MLGSYFRSSHLAITYHTALAKRLPRNPIKRASSMQHPVSKGKFAQANTEKPCEAIPQGHEKPHSPQRGGVRLSEFHLPSFTSCST